MSGKLKRANTLLFKIRNLVNSSEPYEELALTHLLNSFIVNKRN